MERLEGVVEGVIYENEVNGYTVCDVSSGGKLYTLTGYMPGLSDGERIVAEGEWKTHPEYGEQFNVKNFQRLLPETESDIELYLGSGVLPHIGKSTARKIVEAFGTQAFDIIENEPEKLTQIKGISAAKAQNIYKKFLEQMCLKNIIVYFQKFGISTNLVVKAYRTFGDGIIDFVGENPFILSSIDGFTFKICDKIREELKLPSNFAPRVCSGVVSTLLNAAYLSGHTYLPKGTLVAQAKAVLEVGNEDVEDAIAQLCLKEELVIEAHEEFDAVYLDRFYEAERGVAKRLREMSSLVFETNRCELEDLIERAEIDMDIVLADSQRDAVFSSFENSAMVITGGPGTGKTTIINMIINLMKRQGKKIALAAPTGRAAKRMSEVCGVEAKTVHRLLENMPSEGNGVAFGRNERNKLDCDVLIVDEMSMVDILLMHSILLALPRKARLIMVGDCDQLPAVGAGNVLRDIIESECLECVKLTEIFRQAKESMIVVNAHRINRGDMPFCNDPENDFFMVNCTQPELLCETIADLCERRIPKAYGVDSISQIQVLTPTRKTLIGVQNLNEILQKRLNPKRERISEKTAGGYTFRIGDKVMQNKNNYNLEWTRVTDLEEGQGIFNGDVGFVTDINIPKQTLTVIFDDKRVVYEFAELEELELAYAVTVHKSQGSEFDVVIMPMFDTHRLLMTRNLLYTAITRAKKLVILVGKEDILRQFVENNNILMRYSGLKEKLIIR
ncbi:MAG: ATP-dependent RecD-like DNA helicase [Ruminococcaceae bacterium]|nr:ATP-dependent RecD-like DNA helicase [Oscillospiraceae bacterium]